MHKNLKVVNSPDVEARIKIEKLENELKLSRKEIIQCEKEKCDLISVIEKLYEKFLNERLDNMINKLESNVLQFHEAVQNSKRNDSRDNSTSLSTGNESMVSDDQRLAEHAFSSAIGFHTKVSEAFDCVCNDDLITSNCETRNPTNSEQPVENEIEVHCGDLANKIITEYNERDPSNKDHVKCDEVFTISDEEDSVQCDFFCVSRPKIPPVIELNDSSNQSNREDCSILSETSDDEKCSKINEHQQGISFLGTSKVSSLVNGDNMSIQSSLKVDFPRNENSSDTLFSKVNQQQQNFSNVLQKSTSAKLDNSSTVTCEKNGHKETSFDVLLKPAVTGFDHFPNLVDQQNNLLQNDVSNKVLFPKTNQNLQKPAQFKLDTSSISVDEGDISFQNNDSIDAFYAKERYSVFTSQNRALVKTDDSSISIHKQNSLLQNDHLNDTTYQKANSVRTSFSGIFQKRTLVESGDSWTRIGANADLLQIDNLVNVTRSKLKREFKVYTGFDDSATQIGTEVNLSQCGNSDYDMPVGTSRNKISSFNVMRKSPLNESFFSSSSTQSCEEVELRTDNPDNFTYSKINQREESSSHVIKRKHPFEFDSSCTPSIEQVDLLGDDDFSGTTPSNSYLGFFKRQMPDLEQNVRHETDARKRFKYDLFASCSSRSSLLRSPSSAISFEEMRISEHLNQKYFEDEGVCSCSICGFVTASFSAHKRHVNKHHRDAFLMDSRFQFTNHLNEEHAYAAKQKL